MNRQPRKTQGITMLEIILVVSVLAILAAIGFPNFAAYQRSLRLREANNQIAQLFQESAARAINESREVEVKFLLNDPAGPDLRVKVNGVSDDIKLEGDTLLESANVGGTPLGKVTFNARGRPSNTGTLVLQSKLGGSSGTVRLLTTGKTVIQ